MKDCKKRGITFIALITTIVVALIILSTVVIAFESIINNTQKSEFAKEAYLVKKQVLDYEFMNSNYPTEDNITIDLNSMDESSRNQFSEEPGYASNDIELISIDLAKAGVENVIRGTTTYGASDIYAFSITTKKIYYLMGESIGNDTYYTLTDELYKLLDINDVK
jgi:Tfp pilus assembly protein PilE